MPGPARTGSVSPVSSARSISLAPSTISPSAGMRPPGTHADQIARAQIGHGDRHARLPSSSSVARGTSSAAARRPPSGRWRGCGGPGSARPAGRSTASQPRRNRRGGRTCAVSKTRDRARPGSAPARSARPSRAAAPAASAQALAKKGWPGRRPPSAGRWRRRSSGTGRAWHASAPDQTATDRSMTFIIAKPDTPSRINRSRPARSVSVAATASGSSSCAS